MTVSQKYLFENNEENRRKLHDALVESNVKIIFNKSDGSQRTMLCTLRSEAIDYTKSSGDRKMPDSNVSAAVWDLENNWWRSFKWEGLLSWEVID